MSSARLRSFVPAFARRGLALLGAVGVGLILGSPARGDDPPASAGVEAPTPGAPPVFGTEAESFSTPTAATSPFDWLHALHAQLQRLATPPPTSPNDTQLRGAWTAILEPRIATMLRRLETWQEPARWIVAEGESAPTVLAPAQWPAFVQSMALLSAELHGAWTQYGNVKIQRKSGPLSDPHALGDRYRDVRLAYPTSGLHQSILLRQAAGRRWAVARWGSHAHLLGRFRTAWDWSWDQSSTWWRYLERKEAQASLERYEQALEVALEGTRDTLSGTLLGLQAFISTVQEAEQERLQGVCVACRTDDATLREMAETALRDMRDAQLEAERFQGSPYTKHSALLRSWSRKQQAAIRVLELTEKRLEQDAPSASAPAPAPAQAPAPPR